MHLFMHHGHRSHGGHAGHVEDGQQIDERKAP
jgi:hypothetical protein